MTDWYSVDAIEALSRGRGQDRHGDYVESREDRRAMAVNIITALVKGYTRGQGFDAEGTPEPDLQAVIISASMRFLSNPNGLEIEGSRHYGDGDNTGLTLLERQVCDRYRVKAR